MAKNYVGDIGLAVVLDTGVDLTLATGCKILVQLPDGTTTEWSGTKSGTTISHATVAGELAQSGVYRLHAAFTLGGWTGVGEVACMTIYERFGGCAS
ncbi:hypothetical protein G3N56_07750 [Desulfovibrio sulfodismutans]|uniref:Uncharacterized protein n=1 Tax=Desulfolutivibrio sulfodismutans TaxID=63561 RepID=A0A7K3NLH1_9BACT|nr:hypothetical protein [Desulfolutivibrio sulfodismutans]NDY56635.1 hypothetical protein [Desulfolutivibrio sulfodismutans]QLA11264.1 hypothetical protein GD606_02705 [Desulfolutivibrio sulfodismutans DSM 3696]